MFKASGLLKDYWYAIAVSKELVFQKQLKRQQIIKGHKKYGKFLALFYLQVL
jgi:hypothetical protein